VGANRTHSLLINRTKRFPVGANHPVWSWGVTWTGRPAARRHARLC
jgi:hypothetical protein